MDPIDNPEIIQEKKNRIRFNKKSLLHWGGLLFSIILLIVVVAISYRHLVLSNRVSAEKKESVKEELVEGEIVGNEILVKIKKDFNSKVSNPNEKESGLESLDKILRNDKVKKFEKLAQLFESSNRDADIFRWYKITYEDEAVNIKVKQDVYSRKFDSDDPNSQRIFAKINKLKNDPSVELVEPNFIVQTSLIPNDPYYSSSNSWGQGFEDMWGMKKINLEASWDQVASANSIIVASIDTGIDRNHEDLKNNIWTNTKDIAGNRKDEDQNGYMNDTYGWNFINNNNDTNDDNGHGTHTAGTIAGAGNNALGVVGVNWNVKIMPVKILSSGGSGTLDAAAKGLQYAADMGAKISSNSWGCNCVSLLISDAVNYEYSKGMIIVAAAGNNNMDAMNFTPASIEKVITVGASDRSDNRASFSNFGSKIDVVAPGVDILSTKSSLGSTCSGTRIVGSNYCVLSGTSMATPHVAGLAALIWGLNQNLSNEQVRQIIRAGTNDIGVAGRDKDFGYGRINGGNTIGLISQNILAPFISNVSNSSIISGTNFQFNGSVAGSNLTKYILEAGVGRDPQSWTEMAKKDGIVENGIIANPDTTKLNDDLYTIRLTAIDNSGKSYNFTLQDILVDNFDSEIVSPIESMAKGTVKILGSAGTKSDINLSNYSLEWGIGDNPTSWSTDGITLNNNGSTSIKDGELGTWNTSGLTDGQKYSLRLTVSASNGSISQHKISVNLDKDLVNGWPKVIDSSDSSGQQFTFISLPSISDLDGDGVKEIVILSPSGTINVFRKDGSSFPGFPIKLPDIGYQFNSAPVVGDLDGDGKKEIVVSAFSLCSGLVENINRKLYIYKSNGSPYPGWPVITQNVYCNADGSPAIADINNDGRKELIALSGYGSYGIFGPQYWRLHAYQLNGTEIAGFPKFQTLAFDINKYGSPAVADIDGDGNIEIAAGINNRLYLFDNSGSVINGWPFIAPDFNGNKVKLENTAGFGDINGDGIKEIYIVGSYGSGAGISGANSIIYGFNRDGTLLAGWPKSEGALYNNYYSFNSPSAGDIDGDGKDEIVSGYYPVRAYNMNGTKFTQSYPYGMFAASLIDVNNDNKLKTVYTSMNGVGILDENGIKIWSKSITIQNGNQIQQPGVVADMDRNGKPEIAAFFGPRQSSKTKIGFVYLWEYQSSATSTLKYEWPMYLQNPAHSGRIQLSEEFITPSPTSAVDNQTPLASITSPLNNAIVTKGKTLSINASATDNVGIVKVEFFVNSKLTCTSTAAPYTCSWLVPSKPNTQYTLQVKAYDAAGNIGISKLIYVVAQ